MTDVALRASIVVPLSCGPEEALRCFEGLALQGDDPSHEVIVIDDATVGLTSLLDRLDGEVKVLRSERRLGFSDAARLGVEHATGDMVVLVRGAAVPTAGWLAGLVAAIEDPAVGLAASVTDGHPRSPVIAAWSAAIKRDHLRACGLPAVENPFVLGTLALGLAQRGLRVETTTESVIQAPTRPGGRTGREPGEELELTIVIPTLDATSDRLRSCLVAIAATTEVAHEVVIVDNGSPPQGFSTPVNAGLRAAETPYVVVMNDDVEALPGWWPPLRAMLDAGGAVAFPLTIDGAMRTDFAAWCFAMSRDTIRDFRHDRGQFFDPSLVIWFQDTDLLMALKRAGRPPVLVRESRIRHGLSQTLAAQDPRLRSWVSAQIAVDERRFRAKHPGVTLTPADLTTNQ